MQKIRFSLYTFLLSSLIIAFVAFTTAFLAFGYEEEEFVWYWVRQVCYYIFLVMRFPSHYIPLVKALSPEIYLQLIVGSVIYSGFFTLISSNMKVYRNA